MNREQKSTAVEELKDALSRAQSLVLADFRGLNVGQINNMRSEIRKTDCHYRVVKNTLVKLAIAGTAMEGLTPLFKGPTAIAYSFEDPVAPAKVIDKFDDDLAKLDIKGGFLDGELLDVAAVKNLAKMKGKNELRAELLAQFQAPAQSFVRQLAAAPQNFMYLLQARERSLNE
ncbi:MAG: 50S ribosomal protein L10 [Deltaproteobacteria bacterium]|nr:50S ribosomal protein L10 [Deltaproteobacteria bacterium]